jgi:hypothetical protein
MRYSQLYLFSLVRVAAGVSEKCPQMFSYDALLTVGRDCTGLRVGNQPRDVELALVLSPSRSGRTSRSSLRIHELEL